MGWRPNEVRARSNFGSTQKVSTVNTRPLGGISCRYSVDDVQSLKVMIDQSGLGTQLPTDWKQRGSIFEESRCDNYRDLKQSVSFMTKSSCQVLDPRIEQTCWRDGEGDHYKQVGMARQTLVLRSKVPGLR